MNTNFTGSTRKRQVNLGNRSLFAKNKQSFLQTTQLERQRRERARTEARAATTIQSYARSYLDLQHARRKLGSNWDGTSVAEFNFFWPEFAGIRDHTYIDRLEHLIQTQQLSASTACKTVRTLIQTIPRSPDIELVKKSLQVVISLAQKYPISVDWNPLVKYLLTVYTKDPLFLATIFELSSYATEEILRFLTVPQPEFVGFALSHNYALLRKSIELQFEWICAHRPRFESLADTEKFDYLVNVVTILSHSSIAINKLSIESFSIIIGGISAKLQFEDEPSGHAIYVSLEARKQIEKLYASDFTKSVIRQCEVLQVETDLFVSFFFALLHLVSTKGNVNQLLKNELLVNLIVASSSMDFMNQFFINLSNERLFRQVFVLADQRAHFAINNEFRQTLLDPHKENWWKTLFLLEELYSYLLCVSNDADLFNQGRLDKDNYLYFVKFLRSFSLFYVLGRRIVQFEDLSVSEARILAFFKNIGVTTLKLLKQTYLRDLRMNLTDEDFWLLRDPEFSIRNVSKLVPLLELDDDGEEAEEDGELSLPTGVSQASNTQLQDNLLILIYLPFMIPFDTRAELFRQLIEKDKSQITGIFSPKIQGVVSRENVLFDAFEQFGELRGQQFKLPLSVEFINQFGEKEAGIDGGGLTKELLTSIVDSAFYVSNSNADKRGGMKFFNATSNFQLYPNPDYFLKLKLQQQNPSYDFSSEEKTFHLQMLRFLGMVIGKCLYENVLTDIQFAPFFLSRWTTTPSFQQRISFDDLKIYDSELHENLSKLLKLTEHEIDELDLNFTISEKLQDSPEVVTIDLLPGGRKMKVSQQNKLQYVYCVAKFKMDQSIAIQSKYFIEGLSQIIKPRWLLFFNAYELAKLISGGEKEIDVEDLRRNTALGGYTMHDPTIVYLFELLEEFDNDLRSKFLKFVTSSSREPLLGFKELNPKFGIRNSGPDTSRLPTASTCVNLLKLPDYRDKKLLKEKLLYSINSHAGFDLS
ncbi:hypothetical protein OGATHE_004599 [Ogataea polymorpha]|uniref:HECT-type E3 ubiquitin transferase n=1 Tax=Ogataea polymorpha TaxID=460523 RepID=A0A9P8NZE5_9ASCO|nr:hypothetical protein OGATHE_004599 [Ogataea polymorpha]